MGTTTERGVDPPSGTVTFLFTDIEGSTRLLQRLGAARYTAVLDTHRAIIRAAFATYHGYEVDTQGDSFFAAFSSAGEALACAALAQRGLAAQAWPEGAEVRVRMGLHTGAPQLAGDHYVGLDVHRAARIAAAGHGGEVLLSAATAALVRDSPPAEGARLRDLGAHRLKDLQRPEQIYQLVLDGLPDDFPPLKTLDRQPHNLPVQLTPLLGRAEALAQVTALLRGAEPRLVTLTGPAGTGKTRLGTRVAAELSDAFADGVWFVGLARLTDPVLVLPTIAQTLGVREGGGLPIAEALGEYLRGMRLLLLLDNFEQVAAAAPQVAELLETSAGLRVLVTSRVPLNVRGEQEYAVAPLDLPDARHMPAATDLERVPAVALFVERARAAKPAFAVTPENAAAIAAICQRLDGLPLALELAAARIKLLSPQALLARLEHRLNILTGGAADLPARQRTMRAAIDWSYQLLAPAEKRLFRRLAVFAGGWTLEAAEAICATPAGAEPPDDDLLTELAALVDHSLVRVVERAEDDAAGEVRFSLLTTIREYALDLLEPSAEAEPLRQAQAMYYARMCEQAESEIRGPRQEHWLAWMEDEHDNVRSVLRWALNRHEAAIGLGIASVMMHLWSERGYLSEGLDWLERLLALDEAQAVDTAVRARTLRRAANLMMLRGDYAGAAARLEQCLALARDGGDAANAAGALLLLGALAHSGGDPERAAALWTEGLALARESGDTRLIAAGLNNLGNLAYFRGELAHAAERYEEALALHRAAGSSEGIALALLNLSQARLRQGDAPAVRALLRDALERLRSLCQPRLMAGALEVLAKLAAVEGDALQAARLIGAAAAAREEIGAAQYPDDQADLERSVSAARESAGEQAWAVASAAGHALALDQALAEAMALAGSRESLGEAETRRATVPAPTPATPSAEDAVGGRA